MQYHVYVPFWRRHPVLVGAAAFLTCWWLANGWYWTVALLVTTVALVAIRRTRRARARRHAGLRARAEYENRLSQYGDPRGVFGRYPPIQPGWFADPVSRRGLRYFDGAGWTGYTATR
jgi:Protein of unknown function (DUF2510)